MAAIFDAGLRIPEDVALIGSGNLYCDQFLRVSLSTVDQRSTMLGQRAAELAIRLVEGAHSIRPKAILLEPQLIVRESTVGRIGQSSQPRSGSRADLETRSAVDHGSPLQ
jgi:LacI family transcriptional regulator